jgi:hypothetical protein
LPDPTAAGRRACAQSPQSSGCPSLPFTVLGTNVIGASNFFEVAVARRFHVALIAIPLLIQVYFNSGLTYGPMYERVARIAVGEMRQTKTIAVQRAAARMIEPASSWPALAGTGRPDSTAFRSPARRRLAPGIPRAHPQGRR